MFDSLDTAQLARIDRLSCELKVAAGRILMTQGQAGREALIVLSGYADVLVGEQRVGHVGTGEVVGELSLLDAEPRSATVVAATDMRLLVLDRGGFAELLTDPQIARLIASGMARRTRAAEQESFRRLTRVR
jgi:CRP-like cAMP-binding protein